LSYRGISTNGPNQSFERIKPLSSESVSDIIRIPASLSRYIFSLRPISQKNATVLDKQPIIG